MIEAAPGAVGTCSLCGHVLIPKCGQINIWHWSHRAHDCDPWNEGETDWHRAWKKRVDSSWCEVVVPPHRADIRRSDGLVIELQYSPLSAAEISAREAFYGNMWWLFHRQRFGKGRFFLGQGRSVRLRWLGGSRTLQRVRKPLFVDLGGPIVEFAQQLDRTGGSGKLLTRSEFLAKADFLALTEAERCAHSHYEIRWPPRAASDLSGVVVTLESELQYWQRSSSYAVSDVRAYRMDDTFESLSK